MQTFLPFVSFTESVKVLDNKRLGKQRVEAFTILKTLEQGRKAWRHHPAVLMWKGYEDALKLYYNVCIMEWIDRGFENNIEMIYHGTYGERVEPWWLSDERLHSSHRAMLWKKDPIFYSGFKPEPSQPLEYWWPVRWDNRREMLIGAD